MSINGRNVPLPIQKRLKQEANFGCALCGCPILEYAHIIPYRNTQAFLPENMISLCPTHHIEFQRGVISESYLRDAKNSPHNKIRVKDAFFIESEEMTVNLGKSKFINTSRILVINDFDIISIKQDSNEKFLLLDINFFDKLNNLIAVLSDNSWVAEKTTTSSVWNIDYKPQHLIMRNASKEILFESKIENGEVFINGDMYYNRLPIKITNNGIWLGERELAIEFKGCVLKNYDIGVNAQTD